MTSGIFISLKKVSAIHVNKTLGYAAEDAASTTDKRDKQLFLQIGLTRSF